MNQYRAHPWHGVSVGEKAPDVVNAFIEIVPSDTVKYEIDKESGHLMIDRPQMFSNVCPVLYGLVPRTLCGDKVAQFAMDETGRTGIEGDMDPIDICVFTEKPVNHGSVLVKARLIGGFRMLDGEEADDKIVAVLDQDLAYGKINDISELPPRIVDRLRHYFLTYKQIPGDEEKNICEITDIYGAEDAKNVLNLSMEDYNDKYVK
ncbi:MAG: inorganic pyrophosphatase [Proteobacteria bacterium]|nr:inorganic pyrophosphatase [Pseudomonadota bacterium]